jgi:error-prone DNA polymerase
LGLLKIDVLALGMLTAVQKCLRLISSYSEEPLTMQKIPAEDPTVYDMMGEADTIGVFQIESRAQMSMLPRLKPRSYYDLVIQIAIVRPGPIQGDMVHPFLNRRSGKEPVSYPSEAVKDALERTLGVPIFQEQVMQLAMVAAGFTGGEADQLRRAMAAWKREGGLEPYRKKLVDGMLARGYEEDFAEKLFNQIKGFGDYGFPESHSASFCPDRLCVVLAKALSSGRLLLCLVE